MKEYIEKIWKKSKEEYYKEIEEKIKNEKKTFIVTANPEILTIGENDESFNKLLMDEQTQIVADGIGVIKGAKILGVDIPERVTGVELAEHLIKYCNENKKSIYLFGAKPEVIEKLKEVMKKKYSRAKILGMKDGYVKDKQKVIDEIAKLEPDLVLVALGTPLQEKIIYNNLNKFKKGIFIGVGGTFDVLSNCKKRAPKIFIKLNLEWLYRIAFSPKRWKRFYNGNIKFIIKIKKEAKKKI